MLKKIKLAVMLIMMFWLFEIKTMERTVSTPGLKTVLKNQALYEWQKGNIHLFDGIAGDNQCHINALIIAKFYNDSLESLDTIDAKKLNYLMLNLLLSSAWLSSIHKNNLANRIQRNLGHTKNSSILSKRACLKKLIQDEAFSLESFAKKSKSKLRSKLLDMLNGMDKDGENNELNSELKLFLQSNEQIPKFISSIIFIEQNKKWQIFVIVRVKHICEHGTIILNFEVRENRFLHFEVPSSAINQAVVVIDAVSSSDPMLKSFAQFQRLRAACPHNFMYQNYKEKGKEHACKNCEVVETLECSCLIDFLHRLKNEKFEDMFYGIGARFTNMLQNECISELEKFAHMYGRYNYFIGDSTVDAQNLGLLSIEHMYPATYEQLLQRRLVDQNGDVIYQNLKN